MPKGKRETTRTIDHNRGSLSDNSGSRMALQRDMAAGSPSRLTATGSKGQDDAIGSTSYLMNTVEASDALVMYITCHSKDYCTLYGEGLGEQVQ